MILELLRPRLNGVLAHTTVLERRMRRAKRPMIWRQFSGLPVCAETNPVGWQELMENLYDYRKFAVLYVDDEEMSLKYFTRAFQNQFQIFTAANAKDGYRLLEQHRDTIAVIMSDQRMPGEQGLQFLSRARELQPQTIRILTTAYSEFEVAVDAINSGAIYKYITKPWELGDLETTLKRALEFFMVQRERDVLLTEKLSVLHGMMMKDRVESYNMVNAVLQMLGTSQSGGLTGVVQSFEQKGLGSVVSSWIGTGENLPISAEQIQNAFAADELDQFASTAGVPAETAGSRLAELLPAIIDRLTPEGKLPEGGLPEQGFKFSKAKL